jgi:outer membrane receptor protein involved in Fe transport
MVRKEGAMVTARTFFVGVVVAGLVIPSAGWGQAAKEKRGAAQLAAMEIEELLEITVTAQKREENLQEIPISVTAVTGAALEEQGASSLTDLA